MFPLYFTEFLCQQLLQHLRGTLINKNKTLSLPLPGNFFIIIYSEQKLLYVKSLKYQFIIEHNT